MMRNIALLCFSAFVLSTAITAHGVELCHIDNLPTPNGYIASDTLHYYIKDCQGNVRSVVRQDGAVVESNEYYPYGGLFSATASVQPYKCSSKELDRTHGLDLYDSEARWYDSLLGRTTTMDPKAEKYYSISPYLWCAGNPVKNVDPSGRIIILPANSTAEQVFSVLGNLQALTDDKLVFSTQKDGSIRIKIASLGRGSKSSGTRLIRRLNRSSKVMSINVGLGLKNYEEDVNSKNAINGIGTDVMVNFDPKSDPDIGTINSKNGRVVPKKRPSFIGLVHELIHGDRSMSGSAINYAKYGFVVYVDEQGNRKIQKIPKEEAATVGLNYNTSSSITENDIRKEHGLPLRGTYKIIRDL